MKKPLVDPNSAAYTNALLEDNNHKFQAILEIVQPLLRLPEIVQKIQADQEIMKDDIATIKVTVKEMQPVLEATFEEVGSLKVEVNEIKLDMSSIEEGKIKV